MEGIHQFDPNLSCRQNSIATPQIPPQRSNSYLVALTDGYDGHSRSPMHEAQAAISASPWTLLIIGLQVPRGGVPP